MAREELDLSEVEKVTGGSYITSSMTIRDIINTDRRLAGVLASNGIPVVGSKTVMSMSLYELAQSTGADLEHIENLLNDYLS